MIAADTAVAEKLADEIEGNLADYSAFVWRGCQYEAFSTDELRLIVDALRAYAAG